MMSIRAKTGTQSIEEASDGHLLFTSSRKTAFVFRKGRDRGLRFQIVVPVEHLHCQRKVKGLIHFGLLCG